MPVEVVLLESLISDKAKVLIQTKRSLVRHFRLQRDLLAALCDHGLDRCADELGTKPVLSAVLAHGEHRDVALVYFAGIVLLKNVMGNIEWLALNFYRGAAWAGEGKSSDIKHDAYQFTDDSSDTFIALHGEVAKLGPLLDKVSVREN